MGALGFGDGLELCFDCTVTGTKNAGAVQVKCHTNNDPKSLLTALEDTFPVAKIALFCIEPLQGAIRQPNRIQPCKSVLNFYPICPNVLHGACAHTSRNQRQIFKAAPPLVQRPHDKVVPPLSCPCGHFNMLAIVGQHLDSCQLNKHDQGMHIAVEQHVAPPT